MPLFFRLLAVLFVLSTSGVFESVALASGDEIGCASDQDHDSCCSHCADGHCTCLCCPAWAAPGDSSSVVTLSLLPPEPVSTTPAEPVVALHCDDFFQPPRV